VEVAAGAEVGEEAGPAGALGDAAEAREEGVVDGLEDLALRARPRLLAPRRQLPPVHHLRRHQQRPPLVVVAPPHLRQVHAADVPRAEPPQEPDVGERHGPEPRDGGGGTGGVAARRRLRWRWDGAGVGGGGAGGRGGGALGRAEAQALQLVRRLAVRRHCGVDSSGSTGRRRGPSHFNLKKGTPRGDGDGPGPAGIP
jgi:hypothetical protein